MLSKNFTDLLSLGFPFYIAVDLEWKIGAVGPSLNRILEADVIGDSIEEYFDVGLTDDGSVEIEDLSKGTSIIALQGPKSREICELVLGKNNHVGRFKWSQINLNPLNINGWIQGTGYTGEPGYEILAKKGRCVFFTTTFLGTTAQHPWSLHGSTPVIRGEKYACNLWFRQGQRFKMKTPFDKSKSE